MSAPADPKPFGFQPLDKMAADETAASSANENSFFIHGFDLLLIEFYVATAVYKKLVGAFRAENSFYSARPECKCQ